MKNTYMLLVYVYLFFLSSLGIYLLSIILLFLHKIEHRLTVSQNSGQKQGTAKNPMDLSNIIEFCNAKWIVAILHIVTQS